MAIAPLAPWLTGLQIVALLVTADLECTAENLRREGDGAGALRIPPADGRIKADSLLADGSKLTKADRLAIFRKDIWAWGGPSLRNLELQCGDASLVSETVQIVNDVLRPGWTGDRRSSVGDASSRRTAGGLHGAG